MSLKILHSADEHIGMSFDGYGPMASELAGARLKILETIVEKSNETGCHLLTIAGDLFDRTGMKKGDVKEAIEKLHGFQGGAVLVLPGNHDYQSENSTLWEWVKESLSGHGIVLDEKKPVDLARFDLPGVTVYPAPCDKKKSKENAIGWIKEHDPPEDEVSIVIGHGSVEGLSPGMDNYYPMTRRELDELENVNLWLFGHVHKSYPEEESVRDNRIFYAGTPEPDGLDCAHRGSCWVIEVDKTGGSYAEKQWCGQYRFEDVVRKVNDGAGIENIVEQYSGCKNTLLRLGLSGWIPGDDYENWIRKGKLWEELKASVAHLVGVDDANLYPQIDRKVIEEEFTQGSFPYQLLSRLESENKENGLQAAYEIIKEVQDETA